MLHSIASNCHCVVVALVKVQGRHATQQPVYTVVLVANYTATRTRARAKYCFNVFLLDGVKLFDMQNNQDVCVFCLTLWSYNIPLCCRGVACNISYDMVSIRLYVAYFKNTFTPLGSEKTWNVLYSETYTVEKLFIPWVKRIQVVL